MDLVVDLEIPASPEYVAVARLVVGSVAGARGDLGDERVDDVKLAVSEACTNAIEANKLSGEDAPVAIQVYAADDWLEIHVTDSGGGFDPDELPPGPPVTDPHHLNFERGLGIPLIRSLMDEVEFRASPTGTVVRMVLRSSPMAAGPPGLGDPLAGGLSTGG